MEVWDDCPNVTLPENATIPFHGSVTSGEAIIIMLLFGIFCAVLAKFFVFLRMKIFHDKANVDRAFDAGGQLSLGLTAATVVSEWTWAAAFVESSNSASKYGLGGVFWYATGATMQILIFSIVSVELKIRAPGAKTYMQLIRTRFGKPAHLTFCVYGLLTNLIITCLLMLGAGAVLSSLVKGMTVEFACTMILLVVGSYCFIGGVQATSYVAYFSTLFMMSIIIVFLFRVFQSPSDDMANLGSIGTIYKLLNCSEGADSNYEGSYLTFMSPKAFMLGIVNAIASSVVYIDQAYWQRSVAAKPREGALGFLSAGVVWFAIPFTFATTVGLAYVCLGTLQGGSLLSPQQVEDGLVPAVVASRLLGHTGEVLMILLLVMAVASTGAAEIMAVVAILVYDIYAVYLKPYRLNVDESKCPLCEKSRYEDDENSQERCNCESMTSCVACGEDERERNSAKQALKPKFKCRMHGKYRAYNEYLQGLKDWAIVIITILILPCTIVLKLLTVNQSWLFHFMGVLISSGVFPLCLSMCWKRETGKGLVSGVILGTLCGVTAWLVHGAMQPEGGISPESFIENTGKIEVMLTGSCVSIVTGLIICVVVSLLTTPERDPSTVWDRTMEIDNPLSPWRENYADELNLRSANRLATRLSIEQMSKVFRTTRLSTLIGSISVIVLLVLIVPLAMFGFSWIFSETGFYCWVMVVHIWLISGAVYIIVMPIITEFRDFYRATAGQNFTFQKFFEADDVSLN